MAIMANYDYLGIKKKSLGPFFLSFSTGRYSTMVLESIKLVHFQMVDAQVG